MTIKAYTTMLFLIIFSTSLSAQHTEKTSSLRKNEIKIDIVRPISGEAINFGYERRMSSHSSLGIVLNIRTSYKTNMGNGYAPKSQHHFLLFGRLYPFKKYFYVEGFTGIATSRSKPIERIITNDDYLVFRRTFTTAADAAAGAAIGVKIQPNRHLFTVDFTIGLGNNLFLFSSSSRVNSVFFRGGIVLGYTF